MARMAFRMAMKHTPTSANTAAQRGARCSTPKAMTRSLTAREKITF